MTHIIIILSNFFPEFGCAVTEPLYIVHAFSFKKNVLSLKLTIDDVNIVQFERTFYAANPIDSCKSKRHNYDNISGLRSLLITVNMR